VMLNVNELSGQHSLIYIYTSSSVLWKRNQIYFLSGSIVSSPSIVFSYLSNEKIPSQQRSPPSYTKRHTLCRGRKKGYLATHMVNTIPPLSTNLTNLGTAPDQNTLTPSSPNILFTQTHVFPYSLLASILCMRVLTVSSGCVTYTVIRPATPPKAKVDSVPSFSPGATYDSANCLSVT
jgi:hypothetical protein